MKSMLVVVLLLVALMVATMVILGQAKFGKLPSGERLERIQRSPNYRDGAFHNLSVTPDLTEGATYFSVLREFIFGTKDNVTPTAIIPSTKTDLHALPPDANALVWFGHSSYFMQVDGKRILVDPVLCGVASPFAFATKAFKGTDRYTVADIPTIDLLFISHDHWDHLDHETIVALRPKVKQVICGLGMGAHLEHWGYASSTIMEHDWNDSADLGSGFTVHTVPARHFAGRGPQRNKALWASFVLHTPTLRLFIGGDSGYDSHFATIGEQFGPFDLAILENGQYDKSWKHIHLMPNEILQAAKDLKAKRLLPVHSGKFALANHAWNEPLELITQRNTSEQMDIITPMIGEHVNLSDTAQTFSAWWRAM